VQNPTDYWGRVIEELKVVFEMGEGGRWAGSGGPEERIVIREEGEKNAEEEGCCCGGFSNGRMMNRK
jgi:hypothetical protein